MQTPSIEQVQGQLKKLTVNWAAYQVLNENHAKDLRRQASLLNHRHYYESIPYYRKVCEISGVGPDITELGTILEHCLMTDDMFKSYSQNLLDESDYAGMNQWISRISDQDEDFDTSGVYLIDDWIDQLSQRGLDLVYSSGTSGKVSFVPRNPASWEAFTRLPFLYLPFLMADRGVLPAWKASVIRAGLRLMEAEKLVAVGARFGLRDFDGYFLGFSGGNQGIQLAGQEIGKLTGSAHFLYPVNISAAAVRAIVRGASSEKEQNLADEFLGATVWKKEENYQRILTALLQTAKNNRKALLFGTPYLLLELCQKVQETGKKIRLKTGTSIVFGGGWKSFDGSRIPEDELLALVSDTFGIAKNAVSEGYSMTEINGLMMRCPQGRYHVPPFLEPVILDEELAPKQGEELTGIFAVLDPFATSYPGFLITGDSVRLNNRPCPCGRPGPQITDIARSAGREVKGCGGIMAKVNA